MGKRNDGGGGGGAGGRGIGSTGHGFITWRIS